MAKRHFGAVDRIGIPVLMKPATLNSQGVLMDPNEIADFVSYLQDTLIPDLRDSGLDATADDFDTCVRIIEQLRGQA